MNELMESYSQIFLQQETPAEQILHVQDIYP